MRRASLGWSSWWLCRVHPGREHTRTCWTGAALTGSAAPRARDTAGGAACASQQHLPSHGSGAGECAAMRTDPALTAALIASAAADSGSGGGRAAAASWLTSTSEPMAAAAAATVEGAASPWLWGAVLLDGLHSGSGLPWWAAIPATSLAVKAALLPLSLRNAKVVRTNLALWSESAELEQQQEAKRQRRSAAAAAAAGAEAAAVAAAGQPAGGAEDALRDLLRFHSRVATFHALRKKCGVPHPAWAFVNVAVQAPVFIFLSFTVRRMAALDWPGFETGGAAWFQDLRQPAWVWATGETPMGAAGFVLPGLVTLATLTSIRIGFRSSGAASRMPGVQGTVLATALRYAPPVLYTLTLVSAVLKVQMPHATMLHWLATASFTLGLQLLLQRPGPRGWLLGTRAPAAATAAAAASEGAVVDAAVAARAASTDNPSVLVVMAAQASARQRYDDAFHCLRTALALDPGHARAHYSLGQVYALTGRWAEAAQAYARCVQLTTDDAGMKGQAQYCQGSALQAAGRLHDALRSYQAAAELWQDQPVVWLAMAQTQRALGETGRARQALATALQVDDRLTEEGRPQLGLRQAMLRLQAGLDADEAPSPKPAAEGCA